MIKTDKLMKLRELVTKTGNVSVTYTLRQHLAEIEELKKEGISYCKIHNTMMTRKLVSCSYSQFMCVLHRIKREIPVREADGEDGWLRNDTQEMIFGRDE